MKKIFTFWEPKENMPAYLKLCLKTWEQNLKDYEIVILDYSNIKDYIGNDFYDKSLYAKFSLAKQADAIRAAVLYLHGGIWLDVDTVLTANALDVLSKIESDFVLLDYHVGFIKAEKESKILNFWTQEARQRIIDGKDVNFFTKFYNKKHSKKVRKWDYLGNGIINKYLKNADKKDFYMINSRDYMAFPEINYFNPKNNFEKTYVDFYFRNDFSEYVLSNKSLGIFCLHNSWTPDKYKKMGKEEFLNCKCTLSELLKRNEELSKTESFIS
ncbi:MAG: capsular polysaccharide synthesis protein [bacterium]|nr:capsular polysaccharide synthesis protein [bacterium]